MRGRICVQRDHPRHPVVSYRFAEKAFGRGDIPSFAQQKVYGLPVLVHGSIEVGPTTSHLYICLITSPRAVNRSSVAVPALFELGNITLHPAQNSRMSHDDSAFGHHLDQVSGAQFET